jgi:hypothetical protein
MLAYYSYLTFIFLFILIIPIQNKVLSKSHVEVYRT